MSSKNTKQNDVQPEEEIQTESDKQQDNPLVAENETLKQEIIKLQAQLGSLEHELKNLNASYIEKVTAKANEAQELVKQKQQELETRFHDELNSKINNYVEKKFGMFLDCINQLTTIVNSNVTSKEVEKYLVGFKMILDLFSRGLAEMDIVCVDIKVGDPFDEKYMSAFEMVNQENFAPNTVVEVLSPAYKFNDKVIKHALVKVQN